MQYEIGTVLTLDKLYTYPGADQEILLLPPDVKLKVLGRYPLCYKPYHEIHLKSATYKKEYFVFLTFQNELSATGCLL